MDQKSPNVRCEIVAIDGRSLGKVSVESLWVSFPAACCGSVIPAKAGIQIVTLFLDTRLRGCDARNYRSDTP